MTIASVSGITVELRRSNARLRTALDLMTTQLSTACSITTNDLSELHHELDRTQHLLRLPAASATPGLREEQRECRRNLEALQSLLARVQSGMLMERARLDRDRNHLSASAQWRSSVKAFL